MNLTQEQVSVLSNYFNGQANLPVVVAEIAAILREVVTPTAPEVAPAVEVNPVEVVGESPKVDGGPSVEEVAPEVVAN